MGYFRGDPIYPWILIGLRRNPEVAQWVQVLRQRYAGMKLIVGRDKLDEVQVSATPHVLCVFSDPPVGGASEDSGV